MWRTIDTIEDHEYDDVLAVKCQCLNRGCKKEFIRTVELNEKFCPHCGNELGREFIKKNPRYELPNPKKYYPWMQFYVLEDVGERKFDWKLHGTIFPEEFVMNKRYKIDGMNYFHFHFKNNMNYLVRTFVGSLIKVVITRWDKTQKVIYGKPL